MAAPASVNLTLVTGDDETVTVLLTTPAGPIDLTGRTYRAHVRRNRSVTGSPDALFTCTVPTPANGEVLLSMSDTLTSALDTTVKYWWDLEEQSGTDTSTLILGRVTVLQDVSHS